MIMDIIDDIYLKNLLDTSTQNFKNELISHKVSKINCNFIYYIIYNSPKDIMYLDEYYKYFNDIDINIIKNTRNSQEQLLIDFYRNINSDNMDAQIKKHISFFLKTHEITDNIIDIFNNNFIFNNQNIVNNQNILDTIDTINNIEPINTIDNQCNQAQISKIQYDIDKNKQDIVDIKKEIEIIKNDLYTKINKILMFLNPSSLDIVKVNNES